MFDYLMAEQNMPYSLCPNCRNKLIFHGNYYPIEVICQNCGQVINLKEALQQLTYPNRKFDKDGYIIKEEKGEK